ncbi:hypothetical protein P22_2068 [Propionispora sp. 2/2-37]|uniref:acetate--CoA ligase family protein n=1 Tax=Propionispora sp. 2/2-37 TaxID=1677858 RepID=UPI0006BB8789|nr:acetate--CoA ligase family protein [Propionispora sp. 2/2-37]CUH95980.1 hypothetical protein P22_2068 [Propionispora sp. 2/2-37]
MEYQALFSPRGVAVVGSASPGKLANVLIHRLMEGGCENIYAINPKGQGVERVPGMSSFAPLQGLVDLAIIAAPAATVKDVLEDCGKAGVKAAVIITSGFSEIGNDAAEEEVRAVAGRYGIRFIGPNCAGLVSTHSKLIATLETSPPQGNIALISQSGAVGGVFMALAREQGLGISKFVSFGNGPDLNVIELLQYLKDDEETKVIALYLETVKNGREFMRVVKDVTLKKPVIVVKSGRTDTGQRAALSHTGSMAGSDKVFDAALKQAGAIRVESVEEMLDLCNGFSYLPPLPGRKLMILTNSGGPGVMSADKADQVGLDVTDPNPKLKAALQSFLPAHAGIKNPIDLTVEGTGEEYQKSLAQALQEYDAALVLYIGTPYLKAMPIAEGVVSAAVGSGKPVVSVLQVGSDLKESLEFLQNNQLPVFSSGERAVRVLAYMAEYEAYKAKQLAIPVTTGGERCLAGKSSLLEPEAMALLQQNGIRVPEHCFAKTKEEAVAGCRSVGYPVVMKVVSPDILHKSDCGGVVLHIDSDAKAAQAFDNIQAAAAGCDFRGVVIYPMLKGGREVILGLTRDVQFGPVVAFGLGGIYTEVLKDIILRVAPIDRNEAKEMIESIRTYPILKGIRGQSKADLEALADAIVAFSQLPFRYEDIEEADLNPVFVFPEGLAVADARIVGEAKG